MIVYRVVLRLMGFCLLGVSFLIPRRHDVWAFGSYADLFVDNSKYLFIDVSNSHKSVKAVWISGDKRTVEYVRAKGFFAYYRWSARGVYYALRASRYFYSSYVSDVNLWTYGRSVKFNLWHGIPLKKIEFDIKKGPLAKVFGGGWLKAVLYTKQYIRPDYVLAPSEGAARLFSSAFRIPLERCLQYRYPRNEILLKPKTAILEHVVKYEPTETLMLINLISSFDKAYVYMPTWRDGGEDFVKSSGLDFKKLNECLQKLNHVMIVKLHSNTNIDVDLTDLNNVVFCKGVQDVYPVLAFTDCLITDYSSIMFDYSIMNKAILFFAFDKVEYLADRDMYFDYDSLVCESLICETFEQLLDKLSSDPGGFRFNNGVNDIFPPLSGGYDFDVSLAGRALDRL